MLVSFRDEQCRFLLYVWFLEVFIFLPNLPYWTLFLLPFVRQWVVLFVHGIVSGIIGGILRWLERQRVLIDSFYSEYQLFHLVSILFVVYYTTYYLESSTSECVFHKICGCDNSTLKWNLRSNLNFSQQSLFF